MTPDFEENLLREELVRALKAYSDCDDMLRRAITALERIALHGCVRRGDQMALFCKICNGIADVAGHVQHGPDCIVEMARAALDTLYPSQCGEKDCRQIESHDHNRDDPGQLGNARRTPPTIAELQKILNSPDGVYRISVLPNGEIRAVPMLRTVP